MFDAGEPVATQKRRLLLADDHEMILEVFGLYLRNSSDFDVTTAPDLGGALTKMQTSGPFDITVLDWNMPGMHGITGLKRAISLAEGRPVAIITGEVTPKMTDEAISAGAAGIILKSAGIKSLVNALNMIASGERYLPFDLLVRRKEAGTIKGDGLTQREMLILTEISKGKRNKEICADLQLALPTVKMHVSSLCRKLEAKNRLHATVLARDLGLI